MDKRFIHAAYISSQPISHIGHAGIKSLSLSCFKKLHFMIEVSSTFFLTSTPHTHKHTETEER